MKRYRVREGSVADWARGIMLAAGFWGMIFWSIITAYPD